MNIKKILSVAAAGALIAIVPLTGGCGAEGAAGGSAAPASSGSGVSHQEVFPAFTAQDLQGNTVTNEIFARKKITVINIWGTFCPPCIGEMPELGEWARTMPEDAQLIGIVCDVESPEDARTKAEAERILRQAGADFVNLIPGDGINKYLNKVEAVPTTIFVDADGNMIGEPVIGADVDSYKRVVSEYLK